MIGLLFSNVLSGYLTLAGVTILVISSAMIVTRLRLLVNGERAEGIVVGHASRFQQHKREKLSSMPIVRFSADTKLVEFQSRTGGPASRRPVGSRLQVIYLPRHPESALISEFVEFCVPPTVVALFGVLLLAGAFKASGLID